MLSDFDESKAVAGNVINGILVKYERNTDCIFQLSKSLSIRASDLERCKWVEVHLSYANTIVMATKQEIKNYADIKTFHGETKYYYPCRMWTIVEGDEHWYEKNYG